VYVGFYNLETAIKMCREIPTHEDWHKNKKLFAERRRDKVWSKFGHERRGTARNIQTQVNNFSAVAVFLETINDEMEYLAAPEVVKNWHIDQASFRAALQTLPFHGGWASFKIAEIFEKAFGVDQFTIPDLGVVGRDPNSNDGPVGGLRWLYGRENEYDNGWYNVWDDLGSRLAEAWGVDIGKVETCLCKFSKLVGGKYYIGHDVAELVELEHVLDKKVYQSIMIDNFDERLWRGLHGVQKEHKNLYAKSGKILNSEFASLFPEVDVLALILE